MLDKLFPWVCREPFETPGHEVIKQYWVIHQSARAAQFRQIYQLFCYMTSRDLLLLSLPATNSNVNFFIKFFIERVFLERVILHSQFYLEVPYGEKI